MKREDMPAMQILKEDKGKPKKNKKRKMCYIHCKKSEKGVRKDRCKVCLAETGKTRKRYKSKIKKCPHNHRRNQCYICKPSAFCSHQRLHSQCVICGGRAICEHNIRRVNCIPCSGSSLCFLHQNANGSIIPKAYCRSCNGTALCWHHHNGNKLTKYCVQCKGSSICFEHTEKKVGIRKSYCLKCMGSALCWDHGLKNGSVEKAYCQGCRGSQICWEHCGGKKLKIYCKLCGGQRLCVGCGDNKVSIKGDYCTYCNPSPWQDRCKERVVGKCLVEWANAGLISHFASTNKTLQNSSKKFRPDFFYDCTSFAIIIEVDEAQHERVNYDPCNELTRMSSIAEACAVPTIFIRYNPDSLKINNMTERVPKTMRHELLLEVLKEYLAQGTKDFLTVSYLYYSQQARLLDGETRTYVRTRQFKTNVDYEERINSLYPQGPASPVSGVPWYTRIPRTNVL